MASIRISVGTTPIVILNDNPKRASYSIVMLPTTLEPGNTGRVHIEKGFPPSAVIGAPNQGFILEQGDSLMEFKRYKEDTSIFTGKIYAVASIDNQIIVVDESSED